MMKVVTLFSGAGGLDFGFLKAGFDIIWANDIDRDACATYAANIGSHIRCGDIGQYTEELQSMHNNVDVVIGGPPCQGFSVAGRMDPNDPRSQHIWNFFNTVKTIEPRVFVMENVKALGVLEKWEPIRSELLIKFRGLGYSTNFVVLKASDFNVPQARERVLFIGFKGDEFVAPDLRAMMEPYKKAGPTVKEALGVLDKAGFGNNKGTCKAKITITTNPVLRKSPYAGMLFNGLGRPLRVNGYAATLPASMGGNKTPIIDEEELYNEAPSWVESYHSKIMKGGESSPFQIAPGRLRRITVEEAAVLQTFPKDFVFSGSQSSKYKQIGNAVPCNLGFAVASMIKDYLGSKSPNKPITKQSLQLDIFQKINQSTNKEKNSQVCMTR